MKLGRLGQVGTFTRSNSKFNVNRNLIGRRQNSLVFSSRFICVTSGVAAKAPPRMPIDINQLIIFAKSAFHNAQTLLDDVHTGAHTHTPRQRRFAYAMTTGNSGKSARIQQAGEQNEEIKQQQTISVRYDVRLSGDTTRMFIYRNNISRNTHSSISLGFLDVFLLRRSFRRRCRTRCFLSTKCPHFPNDNDVFSDRFLF